MADDFVGAFIVTTDDEKMFHCSVEPFSAEHDRHWVLRDTNGIQYVGPPVSLDQTPDAVRGLVNEWWALARVSATRAGHAQ